MKAFRKYIYQSSEDFTRAMRWEAKYIFRDRAVFFSFVIVAVLVSFLYTYLYSEETLQELPLEWLMRTTLPKADSCSA